MMNKGLGLLFFFLLTNSGLSAIAATFRLEVPTHSGTIVRQIMSFDQSALTPIEAYNYNLIDASYQGIVPIQSGTNMFFVDTSEGLTLFMVNQAGASLEGSLSYHLTTRGNLVFRDDNPLVDTDPLIITPNLDSTKTFLSYEGFKADAGCNSGGLCRTDGLVIKLTSPNPEQQTIRWGYNTDSPLTGIENINFISSDSHGSFSVALGSNPNEFDPNTGEVVAKPVATGVPESSSVLGLLSIFGGIFLLSSLNIPQKRNNIKRR